ncbi:MAG TPA: hypothetical protein VF212_10750 [Longimicrobiales bacterium]
MPEHLRRTRVHAPLILTIGTAGPLARATALALGLALAALPAAAQDPAPTALAAMQARSIGPAGMSGRVADVDVVVATPDTIFVGAATGGVWKTVNGGFTWTPLFDDQPASSIGAVAVFQPNPDIVWVGTGEGNPRNSMGVGRGLFKSVDGGRTWVEIDGFRESERIHRILTHPTDPDIVYVGVMGPAWSDGAVRGVYKTTDGGESWRRVLYVDERTGVADLVMDPANPDKLFAAMWEFRRWPWFFESGGPGSGLYVTYDGGEHWTELTEENGLPAGELGRIGVAIARSDPDVVYALVEAGTSALLRSDDGGHSFRVVNDDRGINPRPFYYADIRVDPLNENRIFKLQSSLRVSEDAGRTWRTLVSSRKIHGDIHDVWLHPEGGLLINANDGGLGISRDGGETWRFVANLPIAQYYEIDVDMEVPFNLYGGMQDNGSWVGPSAVWENGGIRNYHFIRTGGGDGFGSLDDAADARYGYSQSQQGSLMRFDKVTGERKDIQPIAPADSIELRFNWNAPLAHDPFEPTTIYLGSQFLHRSTDRGDSWTILSPDLTTDDPEKQRQDESGGLTIDATGAENHTTIVAIAPSPVERGVIWVGTDDGNLQLTRDGGRTWTNVARNFDDVPAGSWVSHVEPSHVDPAVAYAAVHDYQRGNMRAYLLKTTDWGESWENLATPSLDGFVRVVIEDPEEPRLLFAGTEFGLFVSLDAGRSWFKWTHGFPTVPVHDLVVHPRDGDLVIATHGRAAYILDDVRPLRELARDPSLADAAAHVFTPPVAWQHEIREPDGYRSTGDAMFFGENRPYGALITFVAAPADGAAVVETAPGRGGPSEGAGRGSAAASNEAVLEILDDGGHVIRTLEVEPRPGLQRIAWDLRREGFRRPGGGRSDGPEVAPGVYTVRLRANGRESTARLEVRLDPRAEFPVAARVEKVEALLEAGRLMERAADAADRLAAAIDAVDRVLELAAAQPEGVKAASDAAARVVADGRALKAKLEAAADDGERAYGRARSAYRSLESSLDRPTATQREMLRRAQAAVAEAVGAAERVLDADVAAYRQVVAGAGLVLVP